ncbi:unnamed protein product, partial [Hapterophycus canaliculatus]
CCLCSCVGSACVVSQVDCLDNAVGNELYDCAAPPPAALACEEEAQQKWVVDDPSRVKVLAEAINCSGGSFEVEWRGSVVVSHPIYVVDGTVLTVIGAESGAVIDGNAATRLFTIVNASLHLNNLNISSGASIAGGAIAAAGSRLTFNRTNFVENHASGHGGAVYASDGSSVSCVGGVVFADNQADINGGAMFVIGESVVACGGAWLNNRAGHQGGGVMLADASNMSWSVEAAFIYDTTEGVGGSVLVDGGSRLPRNATAVLLSNSAGFLDGATLESPNSSASWSDFTVDMEVTFVNNTSGLQGGGVCVENGSSLSWTAPTGFYSNSAPIGGAVSVSFGSSASWSGITMYTNNVAANGGALAVFARSTTRWSASTIFERNEATNGGAARLEDADLSWSGDGTRFDGNRATSFAGGLYLSGSSLSGTNASFSNNSAGKTGGVLHVYYGSSVVLGGRTLFDGNRAVGDPDEFESGYGGCFNVDSSEISWSGEMQFVNNSAEKVGGVLYVNQARVSWTDSKTKFEGNTALSGGAMFVWNGSTVTWAGDTEFRSNEAYGDGGAVGSPSFDSEYNFRGSTLVINGSTSFVNNTSQANGGALALVEGLSVEFDVGADVSFVGNTAAIAGGAVFVSGTGVGPKFHEVSFVSNSAQVGGAVSSVGSGNMKGFADVESVNPTTFYGCEFIDNRATTTGGAVDSAAGQDDLVGCFFEGNKAEGGGALRLAGIAHVENCSFVENTSGTGEGPAVSNIGSIVRMTNASFRDNGFDCEPNTFLNFSVSGAGDPYEVVCSGCPTDCDECLFDEPNLVPTCTAVLEHSSSGGGSTTLATLSISPGYWRATTSSEDILPCYHADACLGGVTGSAGYCLEGYQGPYCSVCSNGYTQELNFACSKCSGSTSGIVIVTILGAVALCVGVAVVSYVTSGEVAASRGGPLRSLLRNIPLQSVKIVIAAWQILTQVRMESMDR